MKSNSCVSDVTISTSDTPTQCITITPLTVTPMCSGRGKKYNVACFVGPCVNNRKDCAQQTTRAAKRHRRSRRAEK